MTCGLDKLLILSYNLRQETLKRIKIIHNTKKPERHHVLPYQLQIVENNDIYIFKK